jgi:hypothetical protein
MNLSLLKPVKQTFRAASTAIKPRQRPDALGRSDHNVAEPLPAEIERWLRQCGFDNRTTRSQRAIDEEAALSGDAPRLGI